MEDVALNPKSFHDKVWETWTSTLQRNKTIIKVTALVFFGVVIASMILTIVALAVSPALSEWLRSLLQSETIFGSVPPFYTVQFYFFILGNNAGHFWNPVRMLVWVPLLGTLSLGLELLLNGIVIGAASVIAGMSRGILYPILGIVPHGIFEIPAFILEFASIIRWHVTIIEFIMAKITNEHANGGKLKQGVKDTIVLAVVSVTLFVIAAFIETWITPRLIGR